MHKSVSHDSENRSWNQELAPIESRDRKSTFAVVIWEASGMCIRVQDFSLIILVYHTWKDSIGLSRSRLYGRGMGALGLLPRNNPSLFLIHHSDKKMRRLMIYNFVSHDFENRP